jgi:hypothetical protein
MAFVLDIGYTSHQDYIGNYLRAFFDREALDVTLTRHSGGYRIEADQSNPELEQALTRLNAQMPFSLFMRHASHQLTETPYEPGAGTTFSTLPHNLGVCNHCKTEMLDPESRRFYHPFTSCNHCGPQYAFIEAHPFERSNTVWRFVQPCEACEKEAAANGLRSGYPLISCSACTVALEMVNKGKSRIANDRAKTKQLFEIAAKAIADGHSVVMKTTFGLRRFAKTIAADDHLLHLNPNSLMNDFSLTRQEIEALYSIEKPLVKVAVQSESLKEQIGAFRWCKVPDEGFTLLLANELQALGVDHIGFREAVSLDEGDYQVGFDLPVNAQSDLKLFIAGETRIIRSGERVAFPAQVSASGDTLSVSDDLVALKAGERHIIDRMEHFDGATASKMNLLKGVDAPIEHSNTHTFTAAQGAFRAAKLSQGIIGAAIGVCFENNTVVYCYDNGSHVTEIVPPKAFDATVLIATLESLREGSDRLMANVQKNQPELYAAIERIAAESINAFDAAALLIGTAGESFEGLDNEALKFMGKGGTQIDCMLGDNRFDPYAMLASIISYKMADVEPVMLSYSLFESLGDYFADILTQLQTKTKADRIILCGEQLAQSSLYSRIVQKMKGASLFTNRSFPSGRESAVVGGITL